MLFRAKIAALEIVDVLSRRCCADRHIRRSLRSGRQQRVEALHQVGRIDVKLPQVREEAVLLDVLDHLAVEIGVGVVVLLRRVGEEFEEVIVDRNAVLARFSSPLRQSR